MAEHYLALVERAIDRKLGREMRNNVKHFLIGDYRPKHHTSMFGDTDTFAREGLGIFWENVMDGNRPSNSLWYEEGRKQHRFANSDGPNFHQHRDVALRMFHQSYANLKKRFG